MTVSKFINLVYFLKMSIFTKLFGKNCCPNKKDCENCPKCNECECVCKDVPENPEVVTAEPVAPEENTSEMQ